MNDRMESDEQRAANADEVYRLAQTLVALGEAKAAVDMMRRRVSKARSALPATSVARLRLLSHYAEHSRKCGRSGGSRVHLGRGDRAGRSRAARDARRGRRFSQLRAAAVQDAQLRRCDRGLQEAVRRAEELDGITELRQQTILAQAWRSQAQAFEELGEFSKASDALDTLMNVKRHIRFIVFSPSRGQ